MIINMEESDEEDAKALVVWDDEDEEARLYALELLKQAIASLPEHAAERAAERAAARKERKKLAAALHKKLRQADRPSRDEPAFMARLDGGAYEQPGDFICLAPDCQWQGRGVLHHSASNHVWTHHPHLPKRVMRFTEAEVEEARKAAAVRAASYPKLPQRPDREEQSVSFHDAYAHLKTNHPHLPSGYTRMTEAEVPAARKALAAKQKGGKARKPPARKARKPKDSDSSSSCSSSGSGSSTESDDAMDVGVKPSAKAPIRRASRGKASGGGGVEVIELEEDEDHEEISTNSPPQDNY